MYDVFHADKTCDYGKDDDYLDKLAKDGRFEGSVAICKDGEKQSLKLVNGQWVEQPK